MRAAPGAANMTIGTAVGATDAPVRQTGVQRGVTAMPGSMSLWSCGWSLTHFG
jgi:hypothetical protein